MTNANGERLNLAALFTPSRDLVMVNELERLDVGRNVVVVSAYERWNDGLQQMARADQTLKSCQIQSGKRQMGYFQKRSMPFVFEISI